MVVSDKPHSISSLIPQHEIVNVLLWHSNTSASMSHCPKGFTMVNNPVCAKLMRHSAQQGWLHLCFGWWWSTTHGFTSVNTMEGGWRPDLPPWGTLMDVSFHGFTDQSGRWVFPKQSVYDVCPSGFPVAAKGTWYLHLGSLPSWSQACVTQSVTKRLNGQSPRKWVAEPGYVVLCLRVTKWVADPVLLTVSNTSDRYPPKSGTCIIERHWTRRSFIFITSHCKKGQPMCIARWGCIMQQWGPHHLYLGPFDVSFPIVTTCPWKAKWNNTTVKKMQLLNIWFNLQMRAINARFDCSLRNYVWCICLFMDTACGIQSLEHTHSFCASKQARVCILAFFDFHVFLDNRFHFLRFPWLNFGVTFAYSTRSRRTTGSATAAPPCASSVEQGIAAARVLLQCP